MEWSSLSLDNQQGPENPSLYVVYLIGNRSSAAPGSQREGKMAVTIERMREISAAFNSRDVARIVDCFAEDGVFCLARGPESVGRTLRGKAAIRRTLTDRFKQIPDMRWENEEYILAGDRAISLWTVRGKGTDGEDLNYQGCDIYRFDADNKIVHKNTFWKIIEHKDRL
jgi:taurine dehydrogenase small subunit